MSDSADADWDALHLAYKRRFAQAKRLGIAFQPTSDEKEAHRRYGARYAASAHGRSVLRDGQRRYRESSHGKAARDAYNKSAARRSSAAVYSRTEKGRLVARKAKAKHRGHQPPRHVNIDALLSAQAHQCAICLTEISREVACLDHCHKTGVVRGALCDRCNLGLGLFRDNPDTLTKAAAYLSCFEKYITAQVAAPTSASAPQTAGGGS
jgi:hypothetical protein